MAHETQMTTGMKACIENCLDCYRLCAETANHCLSMGGKHAQPEHIQLLQDCAEICRTSADFMARGSHRHSQTCAVCAKICQQCAEACDQMAGGDSLMKECAEACRQCAQSCEAMARM